jgi:hypothetical protein
LLQRIASATGREALDSLLQRLDGARLQGNTVILDLGNTNEFFKRQIKENLAVITRAAASVVGRKVSVILEETAPVQEHSPESQGTSVDNPETDLLEKAKREPVVQSFLDVFPGQVKAEKMDS